MTEQVVTEHSRMLALATRRFADGQSYRIAEAAGSKHVLATVDTVTAGAASDGNALVTVTWRGVTVTAAGYASTYTPVAGHRVVCAHIDSQLIVAYRVIGAP